MKAILRQDRVGVTPVVAEILLIAIVVVLAAVIYIMASGLLAGPGTNKPYVTFAPYDFIASGTGGRVNCSIVVAGASQTYASTYYKFNLMVSNVTGSAAVRFGANGVPANVTVGGIVYEVTWTTPSGGDLVNTGTAFLISGAGVPLPRHTTFVFYLIWTSDGSTINSIAFLTP